MIDFDRLEFLTPIQDLEKNKKKISRFSSMADTTEKNLAQH